LPENTSEQAKSKVSKNNQCNEIELGKFLLELYQKALLLSEKELDDYFLDHAVSLTRSTIGFFHFVSNDQKSIILTAWNGEALKNCSANYSTHYPIELAGNWVDCVRLKHPVIYNDFAKSPNQKGFPSGHVLIKRFMSIPIFENDNVTIVFGVGNKTEPYTEDDVVQLQLIANELSKIYRQRLAENTLRESEKKYRSLFENMLDGFAYCRMIYDEQNNPIDFEYLEINEAFERLTGLKRQAVVGKRVTEAIPGTEKANPELFEIYGRVALTCMQEKFEIFFKPLNKWFSVSAYCPQKGYFAAVFEDVTGRKKAEEAVTSQAALIDLSPDAIIVRKLDGTISFWSKGAEKLYGWSKDEVDGQDINNLLKTQFPRSLEEVLNKLKLEGKWSGEIVHTRKDGDKVVVQSYWLGKFDADGKIVEMFESNVDITERIRMQIKLEESSVLVEEYANQMEKIANQRAEQLKDAERLAAIGATAGMVGHDIRNPLQAITGDVYLVKTELASTPDSEEKKNALESLKEIEKNVDYINKIVADLQDYARPLNPHAEETELKCLIDDLLSKKGVPENVIVTVKVETDAMKVAADSTFINRIMYNLVNNAVQAMPKGGKLTIHAYKEANDSIITVKDTGVGIPDNIKSKLFTPMFTTKSKGQGFGLAVIKRMTEALGGMVTFESQEGKGTTFIVRLPPLPAISSSLKEKKSSRFPKGV
jgi:PAS domain S-box-containing protein